MKFYSQFNQDSFVYENFFKTKSKGFFLDIGAHDGITGNNTMFFENLGWDGICVEPLPNVFESLVKNRNCKSVNAAISDKTGNEKFLKLNGYTEMLSGLVSNYDRRHVSRIQSELTHMGGSSEIIDCQTITFDDLGLPEEIDFLSIDVEGSEYNIVKAIDFTKYKINVISIEDNYEDVRIKNMLLENGFDLHTRLNCDLIFINKNFNQ